MRYCIRVDDIGWTTEADVYPKKKRDEGLELAQRFHAAMDGLPYLGAVIPAEVDDAGREWLDSKPAGLTIAAHGWDHSQQSPRSEFGGKFNDQVERFTKARAQLYYTKHFVSPFNGYNDEACSILGACGYSYIWREPIKGIVKLEERSGVYQVFAFTPLYGSSVGKMNNDTPTLTEAVGKYDFALFDAVLTLHLPWEFAKSPDLSGLRRLVDMIGHNIISPDEYIQRQLDAD